MRLVDRFLARAVAILLIAAIWALAQLPAPDRAERDRLAARFRFTERAMPLPAGFPLARERAVHPELEHIRAWISAVGAACSLADLDGDGISNDYCLVDPRIDRAYCGAVPGTGERFPITVLDPAPLPYDHRTMAPMGTVPGDLDEDGRNDIIVYYWGRTPIAFLREEGGYRPYELCPTGERWYTNALTRADVDGDGRFDIVVGNYFPDDAGVLDSAGGGRPRMPTSMSRAENGGGLRILLRARDLPDAPFTFADTPFEPALPRGWALAVGAADLTTDGLPELYVANDFGPDRLLWNRSRPGEPGFRLLEGVETLGTPSSCVLGRDSFKGMGVDFGDVDGDGHLDIYVSNIADEYALEEAHFLFLSTGDFSRLGAGVAPYRHGSEELLIARSSWAWESRLDDFDGDGGLECIQATGFLRGETDRWPELQELAMGNDSLLAIPASWPEFRAGADLSGHETIPFFVRTGGGAFVDLAAEVGFDREQVSRGIATADVDADGDLDLLVANQWEDSRFYRNDAPSPGLSIVLVLLLPIEPGELRIAPPSAVGIAAIGARAEVTRADGRVLVREVDGGNGHSGTRAPELHFGLGDHPADRPVEIALRWRDRSGSLRRDLISLPPGRHVVLLGAPEPLPIDGATR